MDVRCRQSDLQSQDAPIARGLCPIFRDMVRFAPFLFRLGEKPLGLWHSVFLGPRASGGCDGQADTPDPIPNSEVKRPGGENTLAGKIAAAAFFVAGKISGGVPQTYARGTGAARVRPFFWYDGHAIALG